jgi:hypothetical protein
MVSSERLTRPAAGMQPQPHLDHSASGSSSSHRAMKRVVWRCGVGGVGGGGAGRGAGLHEQEEQLDRVAAGSDATGAQGVAATVAANGGGNALPPLPTPLCSPCTTAGWGW